MRERPRLALLLALLLAVPPSLAAQGQSPKAGAPAGANPAAGKKPPAEKKPPPGAKATAGKPAAPSPQKRPSPADKPATSGEKPAAAAPPTQAPAAKPTTTPPKPAAPAPKPGSKPDASVAFFRDGMVPRLKIQISAPELNKLRQQEREYVRCTIAEDDRTTYDQVGVHLKGAAGSFRGVDDRPALTLNFDKFKERHSFHDLDKLHLNNSVQDPTYLNELICSELFLSAGIPTPRVTHARVWLNGRDLGVYVLKEGFNKRFLKRHFADASGNLYEGGFVQDLDGEPRLQNGNGPADRSDVKAVVAACQEPDAAKRHQRVQELVDVDRFLTFMALELMTCHWDGYTANRNNYRFYFDPKSGKVVFFPHGMDQMFGDTGFNILGGSGSLVGRTVLSDPEWRARYRERVSELMKLLVPPDRLIQRVEEHRRRLRPVFAEMGARQANEFDEQVKGLKDRLTARAQSLTQQNGVPEPKPLAFSPQGVALVSGWQPRKETEDAQVEKRSAGTNELLRVAAGPGGRCVASWRTRVLLPAGRYRFEGRARGEGVRALQEQQGTGAGLRVSGGQRTNRLSGSTSWVSLAHEFQIGEAVQEVELVAELRATAGEVVFDAGSLRLVRMP